MRGLMMCGKVWLSLVMTIVLLMAGLMDLAAIAQLRPAND